jgi:hypothetical protein
MRKSIKTLILIFQILISKYSLYLEMSNSTDEMIFKQAMNDDVVDKPFLEKSLVYIQDLNPTSYATNEIIFETASLSSNGRYNDYKNGYIEIPLIMAVTGKSGATASTTVDWTNANVSKSDFMLAMKGAYINLIQSMSIDVGNVNAIQNTAYINQLLSFKLISELSLQDEKLHGAIIGFAKDGNGWRYAKAPSSMGRGLCNNLNQPRQWGAGGTQYCDFVNQGMWDRQQNFVNMDADYESNQSRFEVFGADASTANGYLKSSAINYVENKSTYKAWYVMATLRLKDLLFFEHMPALSKGAFIRIRMTVNQCSFNVTKTSTGMLDFRVSTMSIGPNGVNPLMVGASNVELVAHSAPSSLTDVAPDTTFCAGGSGVLPCGGASDYDAVYTCSLNIVRNSTLSLNHTINTCRLYCNSYLLNPAYEASYIEKPLRKFTYQDVVQYTCSNVPAGGQSFNYQITQGLKRIQQLVIIPILNAGSHGSETYSYQGGTAAASTFSPLMSPFTADGAGCCSPYILHNFQVQLGGRNLFLNPMTYTYEMFLSETLNSGLNSGLTTGLCSSRISHQDYVNNFGYIVVDMSRRYNQDINASLSVQISGTLQGLKNYDLYCFLVYEKSCTLDIMNGQFAVLGDNA